MKLRWPKSRSKMKNRFSLGKAAYWIALVGGVVIVVLSLASIAGFNIPIPFKSPLPVLYSQALIGLVLGLVAFVASKHVSDTIWGVLLAIVGYVAGGWGGLLVLVGGILGVISGHI